MFKENMFYQRYSQFGYPRYTQNFNPAFSYYPNQNNNSNDKDLNKNIDTEVPNEISENDSIASSVENTENDNNNSRKNEKNQDSKNEGFRFGPVGFANNKISIFGFTLEIDDLILLGLILLLLIESECDYALLIVLGLMLFNINLSSLSNLSFFN